ncbi:DUF4328 domain-containing protein [Streptomyces griseoviridis]|uniref:DUF4328 domain-containing protein n=1 Tax=Streptomyces griseoviridis TaxID=45398 RepID=UPI0033D23988
MRGLVALSDLYSVYTGARICTMIEGDRGFSFALVDAFDAAYTRYGTAATLPLVAYLPCAVVSVSWFHQLRRRIGLTAPDRFGDGPGWAIGSWLIPVGALWLPYRVALEMWSAATPASADGGVGRARNWPVHLWWRCSSRACSSTGSPPCGSTPPTTSTRSAAPWDSRWPPTSSTW